MILFRVFTVTVRVIRQVSVGPSVVSNPGVGWSCTMISVEIGVSLCSDRGLYQVSCLEVLSVQNMLCITINAMFLSCSIHVES